MSVNKKNIVSLIMFSGLLVPFILLTDLFPFMRFGMFAEPIKLNIQTERFIIYQTDLHKKRTLLDPEKIGINPNTFHYLCRNYLYRKEDKEFARKLFSSMDKQMLQLEIFHMISKNSSSVPDTLFIGKYLKNE